MLRVSEAKAAPLGTVREVVGMLGPSRLGSGLELIDTHDAATTSARGLTVHYRNAIFRTIDVIVDSTNCNVAKFSAMTTCDTIVKTLLSAASAFAVQHHKLRNQ